MKKQSNQRNKAGMALSGDKLYDKLLSITGTVIRTDIRDNRTNIVNR